MLEGPVTVTVSLRLQAASVALVTGLVTSLYLRWLGVI